MSVEALYQSSMGRSLIVALQKVGAYKPASRFLKSGLSRPMIARYIRKNKIDMTEFAGQEYRSFAEFFGRVRKGVTVDIDAKALISPCDGLLSACEITDDLCLAMKNSHYRLGDLVTDRAVAEHYRGGACLVFRLQASDYHHFCAFDDLVMGPVHYVPGKLHSVQPICCEKLPVYRLNRRWWSELTTVHFGRAVQIEVGAMLVGGVHFAGEGEFLGRGEEMGNFELAGSTILVMLTKDVRERLAVCEKFRSMEAGVAEVPVRMGERIGNLRDETETTAYNNTNDPAAGGSPL